MNNTNLPTDKIYNINDLLNHIATDTFYKGFSYSFYAKHDTYRAEELYSHFIMTVIDMDEAKVLELCHNNQFQQYAAAIIKNAVYHKSSKFNQQYNRDNTVLLEEGRLDFEEEFSTHFNQSETEELITDIEVYLSELADTNEGYWYDEKVFNLYYSKYKSFRKMSAATSIPVSSLYHSIDKSRRRIKKKFINNYNNICKYGSH